MRWLAALLLLLVPSLAFGQSDTRKVAIFVYNGQAGQGTDSWTSTLGPAQAYAVAMRIFDQTGTPYTVFDFADSARWGMGTAGSTAASDSAWFREQGYMGLFYATRDLSSGQTLEPVKFFGNEHTASRGRYEAAPASGRWKIPTVVISCQQSDNNSAIPFYNGIKGATVPGVATEMAGAFANGDSIEWWTGNYQTILEPSQSDSLTRLIYSGDTLSSAGSSVKAWLWDPDQDGEGVWYYASGTTASDAADVQPIPVLLAIEKLFERADYTPKRKLAFHFTVDHPFPGRVTTGSAAEVDSFLTYVRAGDMKITAPVKANALERGTYSDQASLDLIANKQHFRSHPHSHVTGVGNYTFATSYDQFTFSDTTRLWQRWNDMEEYLADTLNFVPARGAERVLCLPNTSMNYHQLYGAAQLGYYSVRAELNDSLNTQVTGNSQRDIVRVAVGNSEPFRWTEPVTGKQMWVHGQFSKPTASDTTWTAYTGTSGTSDGSKREAYTRAIARSIVYGTDFFWHINANMEVGVQAPSPFS